MSETVAFVGAVGGGGTTRLTLACAELLARSGRDVAVLDAAYGTQGLADRVSGRIDPDMTRLCVDDTPLESGLIERSVTADSGGRLAVCPARAPFCRVAEAKAPEAAERFGARIDEAARRFGYVLIDTPPIAANQAVAAAAGADLVAVVCDGARAASAVPRTIDRLADIGVDESVTVLTRTTGHPDADVTVPDLGEEPPVVGGETGRNAVRDVVETTVGVSIERESTEGILPDVPFR
ncbi:ParA family protein [Natronomonas sp.]|uniref:ParA family protein n=1 Tax=Natronomonas sp. TaxID=2184060 RepID=UPI00260FBA01|nr:ParA family protein [Natronomonas sp.]